MLWEELIEYIGYEVGPIAKPENVEFVDALPKTRSGKIMRRVLKPVHWNRQWEYCYT